MASTNVGSIDIDLLLKDQAFLTAINGAVGTGMTGFAKLGAGAKKLGILLAGVFVVSGLVKFGKSCISLGSDLKMWKMWLQKHFQQ